MSIKGTKIILGVCGSAAAYKAVSLGRKLLKNGAELRIAMTEAGAKFVSPMTFRAVLSAPVVVDQFAEPEKYEIEHISWARWADLILIAPATANVMAKVSAGIADDFLTANILSTKSPVLFVPAMNSAMWENKVTQRNVRTLRELGYYVMQPDEGELACGETGSGRFPDDDKIIASIEEIIGTEKIFTGKKILITAGPTREFIDPVRFISNPSSGKMGFAIAEEAQKMGAEVILIHGPVSIPIPAGVKAIPVVSAIEMRSEVMKYFSKCDVVIMAAAVADYSPIEYSSSKIKKSGDVKIVKLAPTMDILAELGKKKGKRILVGFAIETEALEKNARKKLVEKNLDIIVANPVGHQSGFESATNKGFILLKNGLTEKLELMPKYCMAKIILAKIASLCK